MRKIVIRAANVMSAAILVLELQGENFFSSRKI